MSSFVDNDKRIGSEVSFLVLSIVLLFSNVVYSQNVFDSAEAAREGSDDRRTVFYACLAAEYGGEVVDDPYAEKGRAVKVSPADKLYGEVVLKGLGGTFEEGPYVITFYIRTEGGLGSDRAVAEVEVARRKQGSGEDYVVADMRRVTGVTFTDEETYSAVCLDVSLGEPEELDFRVRYIGNAVLYFDRVTVEKNETPGK
jgi:hypothetical protein